LAPGSACSRPLRTPEQMARQIRDETDKFAKLVKQADGVIE
jgi:hypothetical protein